MGVRERRVEEDTVAEAREVADVDAFRVAVVHVVAEREGVPELEGDVEGLPDAVVVTDVETEALPVIVTVELLETDAVEESVV